MPYVKSFDGNNIYYEVTGEGIPLVFLPCVGASLEYWKYQEPLSIMYKMVLIDVAGHGKSDNNRENFTYQSLAKDVISVIEEEQLEKVIFVGHSFGGCIALEASVLLQEKVLGIVSVDSLMPLTPYYASKATDEEITEVMKEYEGDYKENYDGLLYRMMGDKFTDDQKAWVISVAGYDQLNQNDLRNMVLQMLLYDFHESIDKIMCPIRYILRGTYNPEYKEILIKEQKGAKFIENVGHLMNLEKPEEFNKLVIECVKEIVGKK